MNDTRTIAQHGRRISANILLLGTVSFLNDTSSEMIMPILPMLITSLGGTGLVVGIVGGLRDSISSILKVLCGYWSDRTGRRKPFVSSGYLTSAVFKLLLSLSRAWQSVLVFAGLERVGKGLRTAPRDALIADSMPEERGKAFGVHRTLDTCGAILGSVAVFILFWFFELTFKSIILLASFIAFLSLIPIHFVVDKKRRRQEATFRVSMRKIPKPLILFILISSTFALANFSYMFFILRARETVLATVGAGRLSTGVVLLLYVLFNLFYALFAIPVGILSDRLGRREVILLGYLLFSLTCLGFAFSSSLLAFILLFALYGIVYALVDGNQRAYAADLSAEDLRTTYLGTFHTATGLAALPASLIAGYLWQSIGSETAFVYGSTVGLLSAFLFMVFRKHFRYYGGNLRETEVTGLN